MTWLILYSNVGLKGVISDSKKLREYSKEQSNIEETVQVYREYKEVAGQLKDAKQMLEDKLDNDMYEMVKEEISELTPRQKELEERLRILLLPKDPNEESD